MRARSIGRMLLVVIAGSFLACNLVTVAGSQGVQQFPQNFVGPAPGGVPGGRLNLVPSNQLVLPGTIQGPWWRVMFSDYWDFLGSIGVTSARVGLFYGGGWIQVEDAVAFGQHVGLLQSDFGGFVHHRKADLKDWYISGILGVGLPAMEFLTFAVETNRRLPTKFTQYTDAGNFPVSTLPPNRWYRGALGVLVLGNNEAGFINLDNRNKYWAFDICGKIPILSVLDLLLGYKWSRIKSDIDPLSASIPPGAGGGGFASYPVLPGQQGWRPAWRDTLTSATEFNMSQKITWHGAFVGLRMSNTFGPDFGCFFDARLYPYLFGHYEFSWDGAYLDPFANFTPGIWGSQYSSVSGGQRWALDLDFRCRNRWRDFFIIELEARYSYASMSGSCPEYQTAGNAYGAFGPYWLNANYSQATPETLSIYQKMWMFGGSLEIAF